MTKEFYGSLEIETSPIDKRIKILKEKPLGERATWDEYLIHAAIGFSRRASCKHVRSGSVITSNNEILASGYNGAPSRFEKNCLETGCRKELLGLEYSTSLNSATCIGVHSEMNALGHLSKREGNKISVYNTIFPCHTCAKNILPYFHIEKIVFKRHYSSKELKSTLDLLEEAKVEIYQLDLSPERDMDIRYQGPPVDFDVWSDKEKDRISEIIEQYKKK